MGSYIFDLVNGGAKWVVGKNANNKKSGLPSAINAISKFSDSLTYNRCTQFVEEEGLDFVGLGDCNPGVQNTLSLFTKNGYGNRFIGKVSSVVDMAKKKVGDAIDSVKQKFGATYYCQVLAPAFNAIVNMIEGVLDNVKKILAIIYKYIEQLLALISQLINRLFACFEAAVGKLVDLVKGLKFPDFLNFLQGISVWSERCEVISGPIILMFNNMFNTVSMKKILYKMGTIADENVDIHFESIQEVNGFLKIACNLADILNNKKDELFDDVMNSDIVNSMKNGYALAKAYTQYGTAVVIQTILAPIASLGAAYNNMLHTRSSKLGYFINKCIGWLLPAKGYAHPYDENIVYRKKYSIADVLVILDSMNDCNDYLCGGFKAKVELMITKMKLDGNCFWNNPLGWLSNVTDTMVEGLEEAYSNAFDPIKTTEDELNTYINVEFIKSVRTYDGSFYIVEGV